MQYYIKANTATVELIEDPKGGIARIKKAILSYRLNKLKAATK